MRSIVVLPLCIFAVSAQSQEIQWRVDGNFRLMKSALQQEWLKQVAMESARLEGTKLTVDELRTRWSHIPDTFYNKESSTYEEGYLVPKEWSIVVTLSGVSSEDSCSWSLNSASFRGSCKNFSIPRGVDGGPNTLKVVSDSGLSSATEVTVEDILIVGIGDSYASGEGVPDVFRQFFRDSDWWDKKCHRSLYSWQSLVAARFAAEHPQKSVTFVSRACSGALIKELYESESDGAAGEKGTKVAATGVSKLLTHSGPATTEPAPLGSMPEQTARRAMRRTTKATRYCASFSWGE